MKKKAKVPKYGFRFPSMGPGSQVRVNNKQFQYIQVPEYGFRFPSTSPGSRVRFLKKNR